MMDKIADVIEHEAMYTLMRFVIVMGFLAVTITASLGR